MSDSSLLGLDDVRPDFSCHTGGDATSAFCATAATAPDAVDLAWVPPSSALEEETSKDRATSSFHPFFHQSTPRARCRDN